MLLVSSPNYFAWSYDNWGSLPSNAPGQSVTPGASNVWGNWLEIGPDASLTERTYLMDLSLVGNNVSTVDKSMLLDVGIDPAGGTSYVSIFGDTGADGQAATKGFVCGNIATYANLGRCGIVLPIETPAGAAVAVRAQTSHTVAGTIRVLAKWYGRPSNPLAMHCGQSAEVVGAITNSGGVSFTPGNATAGAWTLLGTTSLRRRWWQLGVQVSNANITVGGNQWVDLAVGDGTNFHQIMRLSVSVNGTETFSIYRNSEDMGPAYCDVPAGSSMYVRGTSSGAPDSGWNAVAVGV